MLKRSTCCLFLGRRRAIEALVQDATSSIGADFRRVLVDLGTPSIFSRINSGCVVVDVDSQPSAVKDLICLFAFEQCGLPIVAITNHEDVRQPIRLGLGASSLAILPRDEAQLPNLIAEAIRRDGVGDNSPSSARLRMDRLTVREREVVQLFLRGEITKSIARQMNITYQTVDKHRNRALRKLSSRSIVAFQNDMQQALLACMGITLTPPSNATSNATPTAVVGPPHFSSVQSGTVSSE